MGLFMRYFVAADKELDLRVVLAALQELSPDYGIALRRDGRGEAGGLFYKKGLYGQIEINRPGDGLFEDEIAELKESMTRAEGDQRQRVLDILDRTRRTVAVEVVWQNRFNTEETLEKIDPLWRWLFENFDGLLHVDGEGFYDRSGLIQRVD